MAGQRITIIDDDEAFRELMHDILTDEGYRVTPVDMSTGDLDLIRAEHPDLVILYLRLGPNAIRYGDPAGAACGCCVCRRRWLSSARRLTLACTVCGGSARAERGCSGEAILVLYYLLARVVALIGSANGGLWHAHLERRCRLRGPRMGDDRREGDAVELPPDWFAIMVCSRPCMGMRNCCIAGSRAASRGGLN